MRICVCVCVDKSQAILALPKYRRWGRVHTPPVLVAHQCPQAPAQSGLLLSTTCQISQKEPKPFLHQTALYGRRVVSSGTKQIRGEMPSYVFYHLHLKKWYEKGLNNPFLLSKPEWALCLKVLHVGIQLLDHTVICSLSNLYRLHLCDDYTFPSKLLIKVLSEPRIAPYATSVQSLQYSSAALPSQRFPICTV